MMHLQIQNADVDVTLPSLDLLDWNPIQMVDKAVISFKCYSEPIDDLVLKLTTGAVGAWYNNNQSLYQELRVARCRIKSMVVEMFPVQGGGTIRWFTLVPTPVVGGSGS